MKYTKTTERSVNEVVTLLESRVQENGSGILHIHNLKTTLNDKGIPFDRECRILEICNPHFANSVLANDMSLNMALPCRISVYEDKGRTTVGMILPSDMLALLSGNPEIAKIAEEVEHRMLKMVNEACAADPV